MTSLRIAIVIDDFYPSSGGIGRSVQAQIDELAEQGLQVILIAPKRQLEKPNNCKTIALPLFYLPGMPIYTGALYHNKKTAQRIGRTNKFDIVHSQTERGALSLAALIAKDQSIPHIHTFHSNLSGTHTTQPVLSVFGSIAYFLAIIPPFARISRKRIEGKISLPNDDDTESFFSRLDWHSFATIASRVDAFSAPSSFMINKITECLPALKDKGSVIPTGISAKFTKAIQSNKRSVSNDKVRFLSVCRLSKEKRVEAIVQAFIEADIPNSQLDIVGTGGQLDKLQKVAAVHSNITFHKHIDDLDKLASLYLNSDAFVIASYRFDTQGITIGEAAVAGLPIIYCDDRLSFGLSQKNSILSGSPEPSDIAKSMQRIANNKLRNDLSAQSKLIAPSLSPKTMTEQYVSLYRSAMLSRQDD